MNEIKRVIDPEKGPLDGVECEIQCVVTQFERIDENNKEISAQNTLPCKMICSHSHGVASFSIYGGLDIMVSIRIDELVELLHAASNAAIEVNKEKH